MTSNQKVAVVTGTSSGIGLETSLALARSGFRTYATMRNLNKSENIKSVATKENLPIHINQLDVTDDISIKNAVQAIFSEVGRIDVLVNNAGYALNGAFEDLTIDEIKAQFETNLFGVIRTTQAILPIMRKQQFGIIVNMSSGAGRLGYPGGSAYISTKFAVEGLSETLAAEVKGFGINVTMVEPNGFIDVFNNHFGDSLSVSSEPEAAPLPRPVYGALALIGVMASSPFGTVAPRAD